MTAAAVLLGFALGAGLLLALAPLLLPHRARVPRPRRPSRIADRLARAGAPAIRPSVFVAASVVLGIAGASVVLAVTTLAAAALVAGLVIGATPWLVAGWRARRRVRTARALWPEVVDHLVSAVRAGRPLPDALAALAVEGPVALRPGFAVFAERWRATGTTDSALDAAKASFADPTADRLLEVLRMARQVGGTELPAVLRDTAAHLRQDLAVRAEVEARQSWTTNAGKLGLAAPWVVLLLLATRPEAASAYATPTGWALIGAVAVITAVAYRVMLVIARLPDERRWR